MPIKFLNTKVNSDFNRTMTDMYHQKSEVSQWQMYGLSNPAELVKLETRLGKNIVEAANTTSMSKAVFRVNCRPQNMD